MCINFTLNAFLDVFEKLRITTVSVIMSVCLAIRPSVFVEQFDSHWTGFHEI
jgi:hypothetical protein